MDSSASKHCGRCGRDLPLSAFYWRGDRYRSPCKECIREQGRERHKARYVPHPLPSLPSEKSCGGCGRMLPVSAFESRADGIRGVRSQCRECRNAVQRHYNETRREQRRAYDQRYYRENAATVRERIRRSIAANPEKYREIHASWKRQNKGAVNASTHRRRARLAGNGGSWTEDDWQRLKARYDWRCLMCGRQEVTDGITLCFDHVVPLSVGGWNIISNGQPLCKSCNSVKHRKMLDLRPH